MKLRYPKHIIDLNAFNVRVPRHQNPMLLRDKIIGIDCLIDYMLKGIKHPEDIRRRVIDSEVITMGAPFFYELSKLENYEKWTMITALGSNVIYNVYRIGKIPFNSGKEEYKEKSKSLCNWECGINIMFFLTLLAIFAISIMD